MYPIKEVVTETRHKVSLMIQAHLGCVQYPDSSEAAKSRRQLMVERKLVFERLNRLIRAVIDCKGHDRDAVGTRTALELARALAAESWEGRATQLTQVPNIGPVGMRKLVSKDIRTVAQLAAKEYDEIERLMSRQPPFGKNLQVHLDKFPRLSVDAVVINHRVQPRSEEPVLIQVKATLRYLNRKGPPNWLNRAPALTFLVESGNGTLVYFWRGSMRKLDRQAGFELKFSVGLRNAKDRVVCHFSCEEIVGTIVSTTLEHKLSPSLFPSRPVVAEPAPTFSESKMSGHEYIDNGDIDDLDLILAAEQALAHASAKQITPTTADKNLNDCSSVEKLIEMDSMEEQAVDEFDNYLAGHDDNDEMDSTLMANAHEPVRLPNGKWKCNHICSGGAPTKSGKPCTHRCCKEGLDKPRKRPPQKPKRKREEPTDGQADAAGFKPPQARPQKQSNWLTQIPVATQVKRQKVRATLPWAPSTLTPSGPSGSAKTLTSDRNTVGFNVVDLECIDLSFTDDEDDNIFNLLGGGGAAKTGSGVLKKTSTSSAAAMEKPGASDGPGAIAAPSHSASYARTTGGSDKPAAVSSTRHGGYLDDFLDDDDFSFLDDTLPSHSQVMSTSTSNAFKSGASDEMLYQGISNKFAKTGATSALCSDTQEVAQVLCRDNADSLGFVDVPKMCPDTSPGSSATAGPVQVASPVSEGQCAVEEGSKGQSAKANDEPAWVADFDPELVDMFRGYVKFL
jgi:ATP-dependent DNA helicase HFM1/MER3